MSMSAETAVAVAQVQSSAAAAVVADRPDQ